ncbi:hypothetical protein JOQ06_019997 [Pogonophryne albipinna]|uniref:CxC3 like cysteine cluster domain-containing protein n=2 Tax=Pogonophryne albipinna TaxID=1090488 RepID=A0AAD6AWM6_9TELE|nr:hypothetical protein JOQ06_030210 [Pogonophryne albipinna]KAJ4948463.1 hypothetical protein JOQ06_019997 [Pogonophryne albipinna]
MAGRQAPRRTSLNWDESDTDEDKEEIDKVKAKLSETLQAKEDCQPAVKWRKRDQFGRLILKSRSSSKRHAKRQKKTGQSQLPNISAEHVADRTEGTVTSEVQQTHNMIGRYDLSVPLLTCENCHCQWTPQIKDLISNGYWPGTIEFQTVFSIDLFATYEDLKISAPGLSRHAFIRMLESRSVRAGRAGITSGDNFQRSFLEWTYCRHEIDKLLGDDHFSCPACGDDMVAVSLDGNRKMYRFNRQGAVECPYFEGTFIAKDTDVEGFVQRIRDKVKPAPGRPSCGKSNFKAGREATRKSEARLDEEGMMTSVCRHCILFSGLNMFRGEIFAYPLYLQQDLGKEHKIEWSGVVATRKGQTKKRTDEMDKDIQNLQTKLQTTEEGMKQWVKEVEEWAASNNNKDRKPKRDIIAKNKRKLEEAIAVYNNLVPDTEAVDTADAVLSQDFPIWPWDSASTVPLETKKMAFDKVMLLSRLREEDGILIKEMKNHCRYLTGSSRAVQREIQQIEKDLCCPFAMSLEAYEGLKDLLKKRLQEMEKQMEEAFSTYRNVLMDPTALQEEDNEGEEEVWDAEICLTLDDTDSSDDEKQD